MRNMAKGMTLGLALIFHASFAVGGQVSFNRATAVQYASTYCSSYNTQDASNSKGTAYTKYDGRDCANFMSQALVSGGLSFGCVPTAVSIGTGTRNAGEKGIVSASKLGPALMESFCFKKVSRSEAKSGDILDWGGHVGMINDAGKYAAHTSDACFSNAVYDTPTIYQFQDSDKCSKCERDETTCKAAMKAKCNSKCETCDPSTGACDPINAQWIPQGRCAQRTMCDASTGLQTTSPGGPTVCADDTYTVGSGIAWQPLPSTNSGSVVGVLKVGFTYNMVDLLQSFKEDARVVSPDEISPALAQEMPLLIIPSSGLYGMEQSGFFKAELEAYVNEGGTILVMGQQFGYTYASLPGDIDGYGWLEDQMCFWNSSYITTWHPVLAGQTRSTPSIGVDGYFSKYPDDTTVILRRTANGQPDLIMYPFGKGHVITSSFYTDSAFSSRQASAEEISLIRDIVSWAKSPATIPEVAPGQTVNLNINIRNEAASPATAAEIELYDPNRKERKLFTTIPANLGPGESVQLSVPYTVSANDPVGIYHAKYNLMSEGYVLLTSEVDPAGTNFWLSYQIQASKEEPSGRFAVTNPPQTGYQQSGITYAIQSDSFAYLNNTTGTFTIKIWNNTDVERTITARYDGQIQNVTVAPKSLGTLTHSKNITWGSTSSNASFYDETGRYLGATFRNCTIINPAATVSASTDKSSYAKGETVSIKTTIHNATLSEIRTSWQADVKTTIIDYSTYPAAVLFEDTQTVTVQPSQTVSATSRYALPVTAKLGTYTIRTDVLYGNSMVGWSNSTFEVPQSQISVTPAMPSAFVPGANTIPFQLNNTGRVDVRTGVLDINIEGPDGNSVYAGSQPFMLATGASTTLNMPIAIPVTQVGTYKLTYVQSDESRTGKPTTITFRNTATLSPGFDKPTYRIRETISLEVNTVNTGQFNLENAALTVSMQDLNYSETRPVSLAPSAHEKTAFTIPIPETTPAGSYSVAMTLAMPSGGSVTRTAHITIPYPSFKIAYTGPNTVKVGDTITIAIENTGGVDSEASSYWDLLNQEPAIYEDGTTDSIRPGETKTYSFAVPNQTVDGEYTLYAEVYDPVSDTWKYFYTPITVTGVKAGLFVKTDKDLYLSSENILTEATIANETYALDNANLHLQIVNKCYQMPASYYISTWDGSNWVERGVLHYPMILDTQLFDVARYLPDPQGEYRVRIRQVPNDWWSDNAAIDYIALRAAGIDYQPATAVNSTYQYDVLYEVGSNDGYAAYVTGEEIEVTWTGLPSPSDAVLVMKAREGSPNHGEGPCNQQVVWDADIPVSQAANSTLDLSRLVNPLEPAQYYLLGTLRSRTDSVVATAEYPFAVIGGDFAMLLRTDKYLYRPGQTITFTGTIYNLTSLDATGVTANIFGINYYYETFDVPANGSRVFSFTDTAPSTGYRSTYEVDGYAEQNGSWLTDARTAFVVDVPVISDGYDAPNVVGREPFSLNVFLDNTANPFPSTIVLTASGGTLADTRTITMPPGEFRTVEYRQSITSNTMYTFDLSGDLQDSFGAEVIFGEGVNITISPDALYPVGTIAIPVTLNNTGWLEEQVTVDYQLTLQSAIIGQLTKTYHVAWEALQDVVSFDLPAGDYQLSATSQLPAAAAQAVLAVRKAESVQLAASLGSSSNSLLPVAATVTNLGLNAVSGEIRVSVSGNGGTTAWNGAQIVQALAYENSMTFPITIDVAAIAPGDYTVTVALVNESGQQLAVQAIPCTILGPIIQLTQLPPYQTFQAGQNAVFVFKVKNVGNQGGQAALRLKAYDLIDATQNEWLMPGEERDVTFSFPMPVDLEESDFVADYEFTTTGAQTQKGQVKYHLAGVNIQVNAMLDKQSYVIGDTAHLTITLNQQTAASVNLSAQVIYGSYENRQSFTLTGSHTLTFDIPLTEITGQKLFYGIYLDSGRSVHLNSLYLYSSEGKLAITTDKQVYNPGETVAVEVRSRDAAVTGQMTLTGPSYTETFAFTGHATKRFAVPSLAGAGTYFLQAVLLGSTPDPLTAEHPIDVAGIQAKVLDAKLDRGKYNPADTISLAAKIQSNLPFAGTLKISIIDPDNAVLPLGQTALAITAPEEIPYSGRHPLSTAKAGMHKLMYGLYSGDLLLASGTLAFDVGDAVLVGFKTDKAEYIADSESVAANVNMYGAAAANLEIQLDGAAVKTEPVNLSGFATMQSVLGTASSGSHVLKAVLTTGGLTSTKETTFTVRQADSTPPVTTAMPGAGIYGPGLSVTLTADEPATIYYTTDGAIPTGMSSVYSGPIPISSTTTLRFFAVDISRNSETEKSAVYTVDATPPTGGILINSGALTTNNASVTLALSCIDTMSGCAQMQFSNDAAAWSAPEAFAATKSWLLASGDGSRTVSVKFSDNVGNPSEAYNASIMLDTTPPVTTATPPGGLYNTAKSVILSANEPATVYYTTNGIAPTTASTVYGAPITIYDTAALMFFAQDLAGNSEIVTIMTYTIDPQAPALMLSTLPDGSYTNSGTMNVAGTVTDNVGVQGVTINDAAVPVNADGTFSHIVTLVTGTNTITTAAKDTAGNVTTDARTIILDQTAPLLVMTNPPDNSVTNVVDTTVMGAVDETSTVSVKVNAGSPSPAAMSGTTFSLPVALEYGQNTIEVAATDLAANSSNDKRTVTYDNVNPSLAVTSPAQDIATDQQSMLLQGTVSDLTELTVTVTLDGQTYTPAVTAGMFQQQLSFTTEKTYAVIVRATDAVGNATTVQRNVIYQLAPPAMGKTTLTYTGATLIAQGKAAILSGVLTVDGAATSIPAGETILFILGNGSASQSCSGIIDANGNASCTIDPVTSPTGPATVTAIFSGDAYYQPSTDSKNVIVYAYPAAGTFVIGDRNAVVNNAVTFWGSQWWKDNSLSGGSAPSSFKGYVNRANAAPPACGDTWSTDPGHSSTPPGSVPSYIAVVAASSITKAGSVISGNTPAIVIVKTNPGYGPNPGHAGTGTVVGVLCH